MCLTNNLVEQFNSDGFLLLPDRLSRNEVYLLKNELDRTGNNSTGLVKEKDNQTIRALHGCHKESQIFMSLVKDPRMLQPCEQLLGGSLYLYQFKINLKQAFRGDAWPWHQDYTFWKNEDGMPSANAINVMIFLDEVNEFNGPLCFIPQSHKKEGVTFKQPDEDSKDRKWEANFSADLNYTIDNAAVSDLVDKSGIVAPKGPAGSIVLFHGNMVHGSGQNISPYNRGILVITYNRTDNKPISNKSPRPDFLVSRDYETLIAESNGIKKYLDTEVSVC